MSKLSRLLKGVSYSPVVPVLVVNSPDDALQTAQRLQSSGVAALEIPFRNNAALQAVTEIKLCFPELLVGGGSLPIQQAWMRLSEQAQTLSCHLDQT